MRFTCRSVAVAISTSLVMAGCAAPPTPVKSILADRAAYVQTNLSVAKADPIVISTIRKSDSTPVHFTKLVVTLIPHVKSEKAATADFPQKSSLTFYAAQAPLVNSVESTTTNGLPNAESLGLSYRGIVSILSQNAQATALNANWLIGMKEMKTFRFSVPLTVGQHLESSATFFYVDHPATKTWNARLDCEVGPGGEASKLNPAIKGLYHLLTCDYYGDSGIAYERGERIYLDDYGISFASKRITMSFITDFEVAGFEVSP